MKHTLSDVMRATTADYLETIKQQATLPPPNQIEEEILEALSNNIDLENALRPKNNQLRYPNVLSPVQIAMIMAALYPICTIQTGGTGSDRSHDLLSMYMDHGPDEGIYVSDDEAFRSVMYQYDFTLRINDFKETIAALRNLVPRRKRCMDPSKIAVNNGSYDYNTKQLLPFTPELILLSKSGVDYVDNAPNPVIHNPEDGTDWDMESWMETLSDDPEVVNLLWEILGAIIRPLVPWNKMAWFYS